MTPEQLAAVGSSRERVEHTRAYAWESGCECPTCMWNRIDLREQTEIRRQIDRRQEDRR